jgi:tetratricopeptide (TPR) repeat protein
MVSPGSESYMTASIRIGEIFLKGGMLKLAFEKFTKIIGNGPINKSNIEAYYYLGLCLESAGTVEKAKAIYRKVLSEDYNFRDVKKRIEQLSKSQPDKRHG